MVKAEIEEHYICGLCGSCYFGDEESAEECCTSEYDRKCKAIDEKTYKKFIKKHKK